MTLAISLNSLKLERVGHYFAAIQLRCMVDDTVVIAQGIKRTPVSLQTKFATFTNSIFRFDISKLVCSKSAREEDNDDKHREAVQNCDDGDIINSMISDHIHVVVRVFEISLKKEQPSPLIGSLLSTSPIGVCGVIGDGHVQVSKLISSKFATVPIDSNGKKIGVAEITLVDVRLLTLFCQKVNNTLTPHSRLPYHLI